jgi:hypothetical protein
MLVAATDLFVGCLIIGSLVFTAVYILDHIGGGEPYFQWRKKKD